MTDDDIITTGFCFVPIQLVPGALSLGIKRSGREADHSPPSTAEVENTWSYTSIPQYVFIAWCLVEAQIIITSYVTFEAHSHFSQYVSN